MELNDRLIPVSPLGAGLVSGTSSFILRIPDTWVKALIGIYIDALVDLSP